MSGLYATDASWLDTAGRLLIVALFVIGGLVLLLHNVL